MTLKPEKSTVQGRKPDAPTGRVFLERWSPRAFSSKPVEAETLASLFEAARWAPSCYNEQPWLFLYASKEPELSRFKEILVEFNQSWNAPVPVLTFLVARKAFRRNDKPNAWAEFDCGAAWMSLALQAHSMGLATHARAGFDADKAYEVLGVPRETHTVVCAISIGYPGQREDLPEKMREREEPSGRDSLAEIAVEGSFPTS
jgi:nitroreductase